MKFEKVLECWKELGKFTPKISNASAPDANTMPWLRGPLLPTTLLGLVP